MFRIPSFYEMMTSEEAKAVFAGDSWVWSISQEHWDYATGNAGDMYEDDDASPDCWQYEVNAYNVVYAKMQPLLKEATMQPDSSSYYGL